MKAFIVISFVLCFVSNHKENYIYWNERNTVTWDDFKKVKHLDGQESANIRVAISSEFSYSNDSLMVIIKTYVDPDNSFVIASDESDYLLQHEQTHFDIQEIYSRKIRKRMMEQTYTFNTMSSKLNRIFREEMKNAEKYQDLYDKETNHSINKEKQKEWNKKVKKELEELEEYNLTTYRLSVIN